MRVFPQVTVVLAVALAACGALHAQQNVPAPDALEIVNDFVRAHKGLGAATIRGSIAVRHANLLTRYAGTERWTIEARRNDTDHYIVRVTETPSEPHRARKPYLYYVNGGSVYRSDSDGSNLARIPTGDRAEAELVPFDRLVREFQVALRNPSARVELAKAQVSEVTFGGKPAYRLFWEVSPVSADAAGQGFAQERVDLAITVARHDGLIREIVSVFHPSEDTLASFRTMTPEKLEKRRTAGLPTEPPEVTVTQRTTYERHTKPFQLSTFRPHVTKQK